MISWSNIKFPTSSSPRNGWSSFPTPTKHSKSTHLVGKIAPCSIRRTACTQSPRCFKGERRTVRSQTWAARAWKPCVGLAKLYRLLDAAAQLQQRRPRAERPPARPPAPNPPARAAQHDLHPLPAGQAGRRPSPLRARHVRGFCRGGLVNCDVFRVDVFLPGTASHLALMRQFISHLVKRPVEQLLVLRPFRLLVCQLMSRGYLLPSR